MRLSPCCGPATSLANKLLCTACGVPLLPAGHYLNVVWCLSGLVSFSAWTALLMQVSSHAQAISVLCRICDVIAVGTAFQA